MSWLKHLIGGHHGGYGGGHHGGGHGRRHGGGHHGGGHHGGHHDDHYDDRYDDRPYRDEDYRARSAPPMPQPGPAVAPQAAQNLVSCADCGTANPAGARFCGGCGNEIGNLSCGACGTAIPASARFCPGCGAAQARTLPQPR